MYIMAIRTSSNKGILHRNKCCIIIISDFTMIMQIKILFLETVHIKISIYLYRGLGLLLLLFRIIFLSVNYLVFLCEAL